MFQLVGCPGEVLLTDCGKACIRCSYGAILRNCREPGTNRLIDIPNGGLSVQHRRSLCRLGGFPLRQSHLAKQMQVRIHHHARA